MAEYSIFEDLMPKIQALISPPDSGFKEKSSSDVQSFLKKRGKRHNHDYCDACGEKGNILCCDICPASFHLLCHDPPLVGKNITLNQWRCRACSSTSDDQVEPDEYYESSSSSDKSIRKTAGVSASVSGGCARAEVNESTATDEFHEPRIKNESREEDTCEPIPHFVVNPSDPDDLGNEPPNPSVLNTMDALQNIDDLLNAASVEIKLEPRSTDYGSCEQDTDDVNSEEMENHNSRPETDDRESRKRLNAMEDDREMSVKKMKYRDISISLPKCDSLVKQLHESRSSMIQLSDEVGTRLSPTKSGGLKKVARSRCRKTNIKSIKDVFKEVIKEARKTNPKQFTLPIEFLTNINLNVIGSEKGPESFFNDTDSNDLIKLPPRRCYYCNGICLTGEIVSCDYCPAHFHLNCLNPPLCCIPDVKWMCPLHPHHILNKVMKNPSSITELTSWWNKLSVPVDDEIVKSEFLDNVKQKKQEVVKLLTRPAGKIPDMVKFHYRYPKCWIPSLQELIDSTYGCVFERNFMLTNHKLVSRSNNCCGCYEDSNGTIASENQSPNFPASSSEDPSPKKEIPRFLKRKKTVKTSIVAINRDHEVESDSSLPDGSEGGGVLIEIASDDDTTSISTRDTADKLINTNLSNWDEQNQSFKFTSVGIYDYDSLIKAERTRPKKYEGSFEGDMTVSSASCVAKAPAHETAAPALKDGISTHRPRLNDSIPQMADEPDSESLNINVTPWQMIKHLVLRGIDQSFINGGVTQTKLDHGLKQILLAEKLRLLTRDLPPSFLPNTKPYPFFPPNSKNGHHLLIEKPKHRVRAVLCPLSHRAPLVYMYGHVLSVGKDFSNDLCLLNYGDCNFVSDEHAVIFYDKLTNVYELLNYSEYSTLVDGVCYTCDISSRNVSWTNGLNMLNKSESNKKAVRRNSSALKAPVRKSISSTVVTGIGKLRRGGSVAETRNIYKKLLNDIDRLVTKSQGEMAMIAEEDLSEIARAMKSSTEVSRETMTVEANTSPKKLQQPVLEVRRKRVQKWSAASASTSAAVRSSTMARNLTKTPDRPSRSLLNGKSIQSRLRIRGSAVSGQMDSLAVRRSRRRVKHSMFSSFRRERVARRKLAEQTSNKKNYMSDAVQGQSTRSNEIHVNDEGYESTSDFSVTKYREKCRCQSAHLKLPVGRDSSWEKPALLHHGSYVRFGCVEFVFSIVDYPVAYVHRAYSRPPSARPPARTEDIVRAHPAHPDTPPPLKVEPPKKLAAANASKDDLSTRLISILNVLSSKTSEKSSEAPSSSDNDSMGTSPMSSAPFSPASTDGDEGAIGGRFEISGN